MASLPAFVLLAAYDLSTMPGDLGVAGATATTVTALSQAGGRTSPQATATGPALPGPELPAVRPAR